MKIKRDTPDKFTVKVVQNQWAPLRESLRSIQGAARQSAARDPDTVVPVARCRSHLNQVGSLLVLATLIAVVLPGCSSGNVQSRTSSNYHSHTRVGSREKVWGTREPPLGSTRIVASWYGPGYKGRRTASGEGFDPNGLTAASKTLPMGSIARVTNLQNGRWVDVRINDRGPVAPGRSIDLSPAAAQRIGLTKSGVARVKVRVIDGK